MIKAIARVIFGTSNERKLKVYRQRLNEINSLEQSLERLPDDELAAHTGLLRERLANGEPLDGLLPTAFAVVREASRRVLGLRPFDVQLIGGMALHDGRIAEMKTGEGKTLVATMPAYLHALSGEGVHIVTVNDYLAKRDAEWMGKVYEFLGLTSGVILGAQSEAERRKQYQSDIVFATNNELGFDYLRDNMKYDAGQIVQPALNFAIIDEVDSILIDEARTPLIISGPEGENTNLYYKVDPLIKIIIQSSINYDLDEKRHVAVLTENGAALLEGLLNERDMLRGGGLFDAINIDIAHHVNQALRAHLLYRRDKHYVVRENNVVIIDEFTGRMMSGRRYAEGLHQAIEAKEGLPIQPENQVLATITFQNFFRLYKKLAGMTGTAATEADEFMEVYKLDVVEVPPNRPIRRIDDDDEVYRTEDEKLEALVKYVVDCRARRQPLLIGTTSIEKSEKISAKLIHLDIKHSVLNARFHDQEAEIIADAGLPGAVTIATNMAGRGTDIQMGGSRHAHIEVSDTTRPAERVQASSEEKRQAALDAGGLFVIGTERHESRRIDNQLRGRSGRQGDPGRSRFLLSLDDDLMRVFGSDRMTSILSRLGLRSGEAIVHPWVSKALEKAQRKVEARNYEMRKSILRYDDVVDAQRREVYAQRRALIGAEDVRGVIVDIVRDLMDSLSHGGDAGVDLSSRTRLGGIEKQIQHLLQARQLDQDSITPRDDRAGRESFEFQMLEALQVVWQHIDQRVANLIQRQIIIRCLDRAWVQHLHILDLIRQGIGLRAYGQRDPLNEFKVEAYAAFEAMMDKMREDICLDLLSFSEPLNLVDMNEWEGVPTAPMDDTNIRRDDGTSRVFGTSANNRSSAVTRNGQCPCGSGRKFKHCHGRFD